MTLEQARGVYVIAVTPFTDDGAVDLDGIEPLVDFYRRAGASGLSILGMMGEAPKLTLEESLAFCRRAIAAAAELPVVVGVSSPGLAAMAQLAHAVMDEGASGVMVAPPGTLRTDREIKSYYRLVAETLGPDTPFVIQDFPLATGVRIAPDVLVDLVAETPSVAMLKHEDWPGLGKISALREAESSGGRRIAILTGNGGLFLPEELARGADGAMTGFAYPEMMAGVCAAAAAGDRDRAQDLFDAYLPLARYEQQPGLGLAIRKHVLHRRGAIRSPRLRTPAPALSSADCQDIDRLIDRQEKRLEALG